jgi:Rrf2 family transcriptional regulator, iron-sulfur cluster assembly transcription factor
MMLTSKARYAVTALLDIAVLSAERGTKPVRLAEISERQGIAQNYLEQIFSKLKSAGLVSSIKGPGGGYVISNGANHTRIFDIINAVEEPIDMTNCGSHSTLPCTPDRAKCMTHDLWEGLEGQIKTYLKSVTLQDLCKK